MPQVPVYDGPQVREQAQTGGFLDANQFTGGARTLQDVGKSLLDVGAAADRIAQRDAQRAAYDAQSAIQSKFLDYQQQYQKDRVGDRAKGLTGDVDKWWASAATTTGKEMDPMSRQLVSQALTQARLQALAGAGQFENQQLEIATDKSWTAAKLMAKSNGVVNALVPVETDADGHPVLGVDSARADLRKKNAEYAVRKGLDATVLGALNLADTTELHTQVLQGLERNDPDAARAYYNKYKDEINGEKQAEISRQIDTVGNAAKAQTLGAQLALRFNYTQTADAQKAIDALPGSPELKTAVRNELEHRHAVQQSDADKLNAVYIGKLSEMVERKVSLAAIQASPEFQAVRDKGAVLKAVRELQAHNVQLQAATESRDFTRVQRLRAEQEYQGLIKSLPYSDPMVLSGMTRPQVAALQLELGPHTTQALLTKWDSFDRNANKLREAKIDNDQFNTIADSLGLSPFQANTEDKKRMVATAKDRVEQGIAAWQQAHNNQEMPRPDKEKLMRNLIATQITVGGTLWNSNTSVLQIPEKDIKSIVVPDVDRGQIITRLRQINGEKYAPTPEEIGRAYLTKKQKEVSVGR